jgi:hypothetical protein
MLAQKIELCRLLRRLGYSSSPALPGAYAPGFMLPPASLARIARHRLLQFDYNPTRVFDGTQHNLRVGAGIVIH